jgi:hypothetical protein
MITRRDLVLELARNAGQPVERLLDFDRIGPVRVTHEGRRTNILWGKLILETFDEPDEARAVNRIVSHAESILNAPFDSLAFLHSLASAETRTPKRASGFKRLDEIYGQFINLEEIPAQIFALGESIKDYRLVNFLVDFARYWRDASECFYKTGLCPFMPEVSKEQINEAYLIPVLPTPPFRERLFLEFVIGTF